MLTALVDIVQKLFPCIDPYTASNVKNAIAQFKASGSKFRCFDTNCIDYLAQGDIVESLTFRVFDPESEREELAKVPGIMISNTCDAENDESIIFSPLLAFEEVKTGFNKHISVDSIRNNLHYRLLFFPDDIYFNYYVDLSIMNSFPKNAVVNALKSSRIKKTASLNRTGYYLFLTKLTIHLMRPESTDVKRVN